MRKTMLTVLLASTPLAWSAEGMWTLDNPPLARMKAELGAAPDAAWFEHVMRGSARIAGGCSASFVSPEGLVLTNHHCAVNCVEQLSTPEQDRVKQGFLARERSQEVACPAMEVNRLEAISDVTKDVKAATKGLQGQAFKDAYNAATAKITQACTGDAGATRRCDVVDLYHGGQYKLYRYHRFQDVRLVFAPEQPVAFFGGDPDNFNFPRYDFDMSVVRVYEDGKPAAVKDWLPINPNGPQAGEAVFVTGHPGSTQRGYTMAQLQELRAHDLLGWLLRLSEFRGRLIGYSERSPEAARQANATLFGVENGFKALNGELAALNDETLMATKARDEAALRRFVAGRKDLPPETAKAWDAIAGALTSYDAFRNANLMIANGAAFDSALFRQARRLVRGTVERELPNEKRLPEYAEAAMPQMQALLFSKAPVYPDFEKNKLGFTLTKMREYLGTDHPLVKQVLGGDSPEQVAARLVDGSKLADLAVRRQLWDGGAAAVRASDDPMVKLALAIDDAARDLRKRYEREVEAVVQKNTELIAAARFAQSGTGIYPDATFTLRLSYGRVQGWKEGDNDVPPFTRTAGLFARATGAEPYALPPSWLAAKARLDPNRPFNFVTTNDIIGGNSGSPMLNAKGEVVGLVFDGNIHSLGGAFGYDPRNNRAVAVDTAIIVEALDKVYDAQALLKELTGKR
ncbi:S46 family peptidase [Roseateles sp. BYS78W]|uniref:Dipeptidyl-peptidase n=1 Tax=Pelomonas candidula TaxID=3299025 RepID=A0ABW7HHD5_9BURK